MLLLVCALALGACSDFPSTTEPAPTAIDESIAGNGGLALTGIADSKVLITWDAFSSSATEYVVQRVIDGRLRAVAHLPPTTLSFTDEGLTPETWYTYRVRGCDSKGCISTSKRSVQTLAPGQTADVPTDPADPGAPETDPEDGGGSVNEPEEPVVPAVPGMVPAFPGAAGHGAASVGGRGGKVYIVNTLQDGPSGEACTRTRCTLRSAVEASGPRTVVFSVAGIITLNGAIKVTNPYLTIAGQTAPGGGITIRSPGSQVFFLQGEVHDVVIRYLRLRADRDGRTGHGNINLLIGSGYNIIVDHLSFSWTNDDLVGIIGYPDKNRWARPIHGITIQRSLFTEPFRDSPTGLQLKGSVVLDGDQNGIPNAYQVRDVTIHSNLWANSHHRNPNISIGQAQVINNVVYNWDRGAIQSTRKAAVDIIGNYFKPGPMTPGDAAGLSHAFESNRRLAKEPAAYTVIGLTTYDGQRGPSFYLAGNVGPNNPNGTRDNWVMTRRYKTTALDFLSTATFMSGGEGMPLTVNGVRLRRDSPLPKAPFAVQVQSANAAYQSVLSDVGADARLTCDGRWIPNSDSVDQRAITDVRTGGGPHDVNQTSLDVAGYGGYPRIDPGTSCRDSDFDGMPDAFETANGLDPANAADASKDSDGDGYTNLEEYLN